MGRFHQEPGRMERSSVKGMHGVVLWLTVTCARMFQEKGAARLPTPRARRIIWHGKRIWSHVLVETTAMVTPQTREEG